ncbi:MAG: hypothetical protein F6K40_14820 [Okeania sp. SIO3I5]|uniref:hypothetical protein n=1 Tax=Okeania sp. SIO3I5 TaxID=2607805 RepID=UPI0013BBE4C4|nr:hypothetical protein [Okeania sp. SIO3I5]NEQ37470.1 hypothetical protein [Okeania sp. SIO3I5]
MVNDPRLFQNHQSKTVYTNEFQQQDVAEAAKDIQELLKQLDETYPSDTTAGKMKIATEVITQIDNNPTKEQRMLSAMKAGGVTAVEQLINHPASSFIIAALEDWQKSKSGIIVTLVGCVAHPTPYSLFLIKMSNFAIN